MTTGKTIALTRWTFVGNVSGFNMLSRSVIAFLPRSKHLLISWLQSSSAVILEPKKIKSLSFRCFPIYLPWSDGTRCHDLVFWMLSLESAFSLSSCTFIKRLFSSLVSAIRVMSSVYLRLLIFLPTILISACASSSPTFHMMYSAYKSNKQGDNIQPWHTLFLIWNQSVVPCPVLTVASWPANRFLKNLGQVVWYSCLFKNFPQFVVVHTVKGFGLLPFLSTALKSLGRGLALGRESSPQITFCTVSVTTWQVPSTSTRIKSCASVAADFHNLQKEFRVESINEVLCAPGKNWQDRLSQLDIFRSWFYEPNSCISSYSEKH